jgi:PAS domain-containing protein
MGFEDRIEPVQCNPRPAGEYREIFFLAFVEVERMQMIASHIEHAFLVRDFLSEERTLPGLLGSVVARAGFGLILATADRRIVYVNDAAETLMRTSKGLRCERNCIKRSRFYVFAKIAIAYHCRLATER